MSIMMIKKIALFLLISALLVCCLSCSRVEDLTDKGMSKLGLGDVGEKAKTVWDEVGKEAAKDALDGFLEELDFKESVNWPAEGVSAYLPQPENYTIDKVYESAKKGCVLLKSFTAYEYKTYCETLVNDGFELVNGIYVSSKAAVKPVYDEAENVLELLYAETAEMLN